jgi:hypothetical protein
MPAFPNFDRINSAEASHGVTSLPLVLERGGVAFLTRAVHDGSPATASPYVHLRKEPRACYCGNWRAPLSGEPCEAVDHPEESKAESRCCTHVA